MRRAITLHQTGPKTLKTTPNPMRTMICKGTCHEVPDEVCEAVFETLNSMPGVYRECSQREALAMLVAPRMAKEGWRFCPCFPTKRTTQHAQIFELVHTNMANRFAHRAVLEQKNAAERQPAA
jgi:hypothetical protein